ncbi:thyrotropin-releasing hormone receptor-like [Asterias amurensis]|uniref:thyrotropin-releasing hormone receptor-like n=1 Tax=Asterias amurensis TaxID=7602 RepID=UPI003AB535B6
MEATEPNTSSLNTVNECSDFSPLDLTDEEDAAIFVLNAGTGRIMMIVLYSILAVGIPSNLAFLFVVYRVRCMQTSTNVYLSSLAISDIMFLVVSIVQYYFYFINPVRSHIPSAELVTCVGAFIPQYITYFASVSMVTMVTLERYKAVCKPLEKIRRSRGKAWLWKLVIGSWAVAVGLAGISMLRYGKLIRYCAIWPDRAEYDDLPVVLGYCVPVNTWGLVAGHLLEIVVFIVGMITNVTMYVMMIFSLHTRVKRKREHSVVPSSHTKEALNVRNQVALMLVSNGVVFFLCQLPYVACSCATLIENLMGVPRTVTYKKLVILTTISHVCLFLNSAVNPFIYNVSSRHYRNAFVQAFFGSSAKGNHQRVVRTDKYKDAML